MRRITSTLLLGFVLALPIAASAGEKSDAKTVEVAAATVDAGPKAPAARSTDEKKSERRDSDRVRGSRNVDPGVRFNNPYAFPLQTLPISLPNLTTISF
jgi:hypothetical protein